MEFLCISCFCSVFTVFSREKLEPPILLLLLHILYMAHVNLIIGWGALGHSELKPSKKDVLSMVRVRGGVQKCTAVPGQGWPKGDPKSIFLERLLL